MTVSSHNVCVVAPAEEKRRSGPILAWVLRILISQATVPKVSLIIRRAIGGAYATLNSKDLGSDYNLAWAGAEISVLGMEAALDLLLNNKSGMGEKNNSLESYEELRAEYEEKIMNPFQAAARGLIDKVIKPSDSRRDLILAFNRLHNKKSPARWLHGGARSLRKNSLESASPDCRVELLTSPICALAGRR